MADIKLLTHEEGFKMVSANGNLALPPNNEIVYDDKGNPSVMVKIPKLTYEDLGLPGSGTFPAWIVDGKEVPYIYISKYQNIVSDGRAYSLPYQQPRNYVNFDQAVEFCQAKGKGWHLMSNLEWQAIALWCAKNNCMPGGNNNYDYGDYYQTSEKGAPMPYRKYIDPADPEMGYYDHFLTATGSGPKSWFHNNDFSGIADLNGNVLEWVGGIRFHNGEVQVIPENNTALHLSQAADSVEWKAILPGTTANNASLVAPGTPGSLILTPSGLGVSGKDTAGVLSSVWFEITADKCSANLTVIPKEAYAHGLLNPGIESERDDYASSEKTADRLCCRGGYYGDEDLSGVFYFDSYDRSLLEGTLGFRSAFVNL